MTHIALKNKLSGLFPDDDWSNPRRHISALIKGGKIVAYGESSLGGRLYYGMERGRSCHSEISVLKHISHVLNDKRKVAKYTMWNIRWDRNGRIVESKPCINCQKVLLSVGIKTIVFSTNNGKFIKTRVENLECTQSSGFKY